MQINCNMLIITLLITYHGYACHYRQTQPIKCKILQEDQVLTCPDPNTTYLGAIRSSSPIGPLT